MTRRLLSTQKILNLSSDPLTGTSGELYFNTTSSIYRYHDGTSWVDLGAGSFLENIDHISFDTTSTYAVGEGELAWDSTYSTLDLGLSGGSVLQVGQEVVYHIFNDSGDQIDDGMIVYATGIHGDQITAAPAIADGSIPAKYFLGIATQNIADQATGYVTWFGKVNDIVGTIADGSVLYASPTTAGALTTTEPESPNLKLPVAFVVRQHGTNMDLMVRMSNGAYLSELHDVQISSKQNGDIFLYNSSNTRWENSKTLTGDYSLSGSLSLDNGKTNSSSTNLNLDNTNFTVDSFSTSSYTSAEYFIQAKQGSLMTTSRFMVIWDGTDVSTHEYAIIHSTSGAANLSISATESAGTITVNAISSDATTTNVSIKTMIQYINS